MSWEEICTKTIPCPCKKGIISQTEYGNEQNRHKYGPVEIHCPECRQTYKVETVSHPKPHSDHKGERSYYLTPIDYPPYSGIQEAALFGAAKRSTDSEFSLYLVENFSLRDLLYAKAEYKSKRSSAKVTGAAKQICKEHKRIFDSVKAVLVIEQINRAIRQYKTHPGSYDERMPIRKQEQEEREAYALEKQRHQIHLDL